MTTFTEKALAQDRAELLDVLKQLVKAADWRTNMSDIPLLDALALARAVIAKMEWIKT